MPKLLCHSMCVLCAVVICMAGCAAPNAQPDYRQTGQLIRERTAAQEVYDPDTDPLVYDKVDALLQGGVRLQEAVQIALLNNRAWQSQFHEIGVSQADVVQSGLLTNPSLSLAASFPEGGGRSKINLDLGQELVDLWQIPVRRKISQAQLDRTVMAVAQRAVELASEVKAAYWRVVADRRTEAALRHNLEVVEESVRIAQRQFEAGAVSELDVDLVRAGAFDVELELTSVQEWLGVAETELARTMGLHRPTGGINLLDDLPAPQPTGDRAALLSAAMDRRFDARLAEAEVRAAEEELVRQRRLLVPSVRAGLTMERSANRAMPGRKVLADTVRESVRNGRLTAPTIQSKAERDLASRQEIDLLLGPSVQVTLPVWDQNQAQIAKARLRAQQKVKDYQDRLELIATQVDRALITMGKTSARVDFYDRLALPLAERNRQASQKVYESGEQSVLVLIEAQRAAIAREVGYVRTLGEYAAALAELERAVGGQLPEVAATQPTASQPAGPGTGS